MGGVEVLQLRLEQWIVLVPRVDNKNKNNNKNNIYGQDKTSTSSYMKSSIFIYFRSLFPKDSMLNVHVPFRPKFGLIMDISGKLALFSQFHPCYKR